MSNNHYGKWVTIRIHCGDGRIQRALLEYAESFGGFSDLVVAPGGVKKFLENTAYREKVLEDLAIYSRLHNPSTILVIQHEDCGAYGGKAAFKNSKAEIEHQRRELERAVPILQEYFPDKRIILGFMSLDGKVIQFANVVPVA